MEGGLGLGAVNCSVSDLRGRTVLNMTRYMRTQAVRIMGHSEMQATCILLKGRLRSPSGVARADFPFLKPCFQGQGAGHLQP